MGKRDDILIRFGQRVRELRRAKNMTQEEFAFRCGLDRSYLSGIERGRRNVSLKNIALLARKLELALAELMDSL